MVVIHLYTHSYTHVYVPILVMSNNVSFCTLHEIYLCVWFFHNFSPSKLLLCCSFTKSFGGLREFRWLCQPRKVLKWIYVVICILHMFQYLYVCTNVPFICGCLWMNEYVCVFVLCVCVCDCQTMANLCD